MKRKIITILVLVMAAYYGLHSYLKWQRHQHRRAAIALYTCDIDRVDNLAFTRTLNGKTENFQFEKKIPESGGQAPLSYQNALAEWRISGVVEGEADKAKVVRVLSAICESKQAEPIDSSYEHKKIIGQDPIRLEIQPSKEASNKGDTKAMPIVTFSAIVGGVDPSRGLMVEILAGNIPGLYRVPLVLRQSLSHAAKDFLNHKVARLAADDLQEVDVTHGIEVIHFERASDGWKLSQKKLKRMSKGEASRFLNRLTNLVAMEVQDSAFFPDLCRKTKSLVSVKVNAVDGRVEEFRFWRGAESGANLFACSTQRQAKFLVNREMEKYLTMNFSDLVK